MKQKTNDEMKRNAKFVRRGLCFSLAPPIYFLLVARIMCSSFTFVESLSTIRWSSFRPYSGTCYSITVLIKRIISGLIKITLFVEWVANKIECNIRDYVGWTHRGWSSNCRRSARETYTRVADGTRGLPWSCLFFFFFFFSLILLTLPRKRGKTRVRVRRNNRILEKIFSFKKDPSSFKVFV